MRQKIRNADNRTKRLFGQLSAERKKTVLAMCLITVMVFMWVRVLGRKTPQAAKATSTAQQRDSKSQSDSQLKISFIELPKVPGRNDVMKRDFFASDGWQNFIKEGENLAGIEEVNVVSTDGGEEVITRVAQKLKLEAIVLSENPQAFINDELLSVGDKLLIRDRTDKYEFEVVGIEENAVFIRCAQARITLKLTPTIEVTD